MAPDPRILKARREDVGTILAFMHATASEQNVLHAVTATEAGLLSTLEFANSPQVSHISHPAPGKVLLAEDSEGKITGMAIYFFTYDDWAAKPGVCLEDLFVLEEYRRHGYARLLVQAVAKHAVNLGCERMEWLCYKQNNRALSFYTGLGAKEMHSLTFLRLENRDMVQLADTEAEQQHH